MLPMTVNLTKLDSDLSVTVPVSMIAPVAPLDVFGWRNQLLMRRLLMVVERHLDGVRR